MARGMVGSDREVWDDLVSGQVVIVAARWLLILFGLAITLWRPAPADFDHVRLSVFALLLLSVGNFYVHTRVLVRRTVPEPLVYAASAADLAVISLLTAAFGGLSAPIFVFYFPVVIAFALAFPPRVTIVFSSALLLFYTFICAPGLTDAVATEGFLLRLLAIGGVAMVANVSLGVERERRRALYGDRLAPEDRSAAQESAWDVERRLRAQYDLRVGGGAGSGS